MQAEIARLTRLVDDLLLLAQSDRDDFLHRDAVPLDEFVTELWDGLSLIAERDFEVGLLEQVTVNADPDRLAQALRNLARNAIAHTAAPDGLVRIDVVRHGDGIVRIAVSDNGPGIASTDRERVFERFTVQTPPGPHRRWRRTRPRDRARHRRRPRRHSPVTESPSGGAAFELDLPFDASSHTDQG